MFGGKVVLLVRDVRVSTLSIQKNSNKIRNKYFIMYRLRSNQCFKNFKIMCIERKLQLMKY